MSIFHRRASLHLFVFIRVSPLSLSLSRFLYLTFRFPSIRLPCSSFRRKCGSNGEGVGGGVSITEGRTGNYGNRAAIKSEIEMEERELDERAVVQIESLLRHSNPRVFLLVDAPRTKFSLSLSAFRFPSRVVCRRNYDGCEKKRMVWRKKRDLKFSVTPFTWIPCLRNL